MKLKIQGTVGGETVNLTLSLESEEKPERVKVLSPLEDQDSLASERPPGGSFIWPKTRKPERVTVLSRGAKVRLIKDYRIRTGCDLREAVDYFNSHLEDRFI